MALRSLSSGGLWVPSMPYTDPFITASTYLIDASGERAVLILRCPKAGTLDRFDALVGTVLNSPDNGLRFSFQGVDAATGLNDGTILGATNNAFVTYAHTVTTGWKSTNFGETVTVTRGQMIACVIDFPSFVASDSVTISHIATGAEAGLPYGISVTSSKQIASLPIVGLHYTDGYAFVSPLVPGGDTLASVTYQVGTAVADEWGLAFQLPFPCKLNQISAGLLLSAGADCEILVYDSDGSTVLATLTQDGDIASSASGVRQYQFILGSEVTLAKNLVYRVTIRPTTANTVGLRYFTFQSVALLDTMEGGQNFYMTSRLDQAGSWTDYNSGTFRRPRISLNLSALDDGASSIEITTPQIMIPFRAVGY